MTQRDEEILKASIEFHEEEYKCDGISYHFIEGAKWADEHPKNGLVSVDTVYRYLVERDFFTEDEAKEVCKGLKEESVVQPDYDKIAMYDCHTCANYQTKCNPENGEFECKNPPFTSMYDNEKLPFPRVNEFEVGASYRR